MENDTATATLSHDTIPSYHTVAHVLSVRIVHAECNRAHPRCQSALSFSFADDTHDKTDAAYSNCLSVRQSISPRQHGPRVKIVSTAYYLKKLSGHGGAGGNSVVIWPFLTPICCTNVLLAAD